MIDRGSSSNSADLLACRYKYWNEILRPISARSEIGKKRNLRAGKSRHIFLNIDRFPYTMFSGVQIFNDGRDGRRIEILHDVDDAVDFVWTY